jgi:hypothetical protein
MSDLIQVRRDTAANWTAENPVLAGGEFGLESDTDRLKLGDGATHWNDLKYRDAWPATVPRTHDGGVQLTTVYTGSFDTTADSIIENYVPLKAGAPADPPFLASWWNEWGALRGTSPYAWGDALVRGKRHDASGITAGNVVELEDSTNDVVVWGRQWIDGALVRNGIVMADVYITDDADTDPNIATLPDRTLVVEVSS